jgi:hypothetical protein
MQVGSRKSVRQKVSTNLSTGTFESSWIMANCNLQFLVMRIRHRKSELTSIQISSLNQVLLYISAPLR